MCGDLPQRLLASHRRRAASGRLLPCRVGPIGHHWRFAIIAEIATAAGIGTAETGIGTVVDYGVAAIGVCPLPNMWAEATKVMVSIYGAVQAGAGAHRSANPPPASHQPAGACPAWPATAATTTRSPPTAFQEHATRHDSVYGIAGDDPRIAKLLRLSLTKLAAGPNRPLQEMAEGAPDGHVDLRHAAVSETYGDELGTAFNRFWTDYQHLDLADRDQLAAGAQQQLDELLDGPPRT